MLFDWFGSADDNSYLCFSHLDEKGLKMDSCWCDMFGEKRLLIVEVKTHTSTTFHNPAAPLFSPNCQFRKACQRGGGEMPSSFSSSTDKGPSKRWPRQIVRECCFATDWFPNCMASILVCQLLSLQKLSALYTIILPINQPDLYLSRSLKKYTLSQILFWVLNQPLGPTHFSSWPIFFI